LSNTKKGGHTLKLIFGNPSNTVIVIGFTDDMDTL
jgi:hypothetical protein